MVITHEINYAFDSSGMQYDENGNAVNWWIEEDVGGFTKLCEKVADFYKGQEATPGILMAPIQTLAEHITDLGAMAYITALDEKQKDFDF